jgi:serine/threonine-protein kinase RsbW
MAKAGSNSNSGKGKRNGAAAHGSHAPKRASSVPPKRAGGIVGRNHAPMTFTIRSDFAAGHDVQKRILDAVEAAGFNSQSTFAIKLALEEALINAIKHGNKLDEKKNVHIEASVTPELTEITIEDEGPGFDRTSVPDPTLEENLDKCSGRGILLMEAYMNRVEWSRGGRRVRMVKKNEADLLPR